MGRKATPEQIAKTTAHHIGKVVSEEQKAKTSVAIKELYKDPEYNKRRIAGLKRKYETDPEYRQRLRDGQKNRPQLTDEQKAQISATLTGKVQSEETKLKRAESLRLSWEERKARVREQLLSQVRQPATALKKS